MGLALLLNAVAAVFSAVYIESLFFMTRCGDAFFFKGCANPHAVHDGKYADEDQRPIIHFSDSGTRLFCGCSDNRMSPFRQSAPRLPMWTGRWLRVLLR